MYLIVAFFSGVMAYQFLRAQEETLKPLGAFLFGILWPIGWLIYGFGTFVDWVKPIIKYLRRYDKIA